MMPMLIGHSQGGMMAMRILYELDGTFHESHPGVGSRGGHCPSARTTIRDPLDRRHAAGRRTHRRLCRGLATGKLPRILLGQWDMMAKLRRIPDTVDDFTGFSIPWDADCRHIRAIPSPMWPSVRRGVRNVTLPAGTSHVGMPETAQLAANESRARGSTHMSRKPQPPPARVAASTRRTSCTQPTSGTA